MDSYVEIFDLTSGNVVDIYDSESDAIDALVEIALVQGANAVERFALTHEQNGQSRLIAMQHDLVRLIANKMSQLRPAPAS